MTARPRALLWRGELLHLLSMFAVLAFCGWIVAGLSGAVIALLTTMVMAAVVPRLPLGASMRLLGAAPLPFHAAPGLHRLIASLARRAGLPRAPALYGVASPVPNAGAVGDPGHGGLAVTEGLLRLLPPRELEAVLAHEIGHLAAGDAELMRLTDLLGRVTHAVTTWGLILALLVTLLTPHAPPLSLGSLLLLALAPGVVMLIGLGLSRRREFAADEAAVALTGDPHALALALLRIEQATRWSLRRLFGRWAVARVPAPLSSHPATEERIRRLQAMTPPGPWSQRLRAA